MFPVIHSFFVRPWRICGPASGHARSRCFRCTAVRMKRPATSLASFGTGTDFSCCFTTVGLTPGAGLMFSFVAVLPKKTIRNATRPATRTRPEIHGARRARRREVLRRAGYALTSLRVDDEIARRVRSEDGGLAP